MQRSVLYISGTVDSSCSCQPGIYHDVPTLSGNFPKPQGLGFRVSMLQVVGSIYIPEVNYVMMVLTVVTIAIFKTTIQLGNAYGNACSSLCLQLPA